MLNFPKTTREEMRLIGEIADRAMALVAPAKFDRLSMLMDLEFAHAQFDMRLHDMLTGRDADLLHDVFGISASIDRRTGKIGACFVPRYAQGR